MTMSVYVTAGQVEVAVLKNDNECLSDSCQFYSQLAVLLTAGQVEVAVLLVQGEEVEQHGAGDHQGDSDAEGENPDMLLCRCRAALDIVVSREGVKRKQ